MAGQLPDHELQVFSRNHAIIVHIKDCEYEAQSVFPAGALAAGFQSMHKLLQSGERISCTKDGSLQIKFSDTAHEVVSFTMLLKAESGPFLHHLEVHMIEDLAHSRMKRVDT